MPEQLHFPDALHHQHVPKSRRLCGVILHAILLVLFASGVLRATATTSSLTAQVSNMTVPSGGTAQIRVVLASPQSLLSGEIVVDLDPIIFGDIITADIFSATGDQLGTAYIQGRHLDVQFLSTTAGIGRLPGVPILTVAVPVLAGAPQGAVSSITFQSGNQLPWIDVENVTYSVTAIPGTLTVGGSLSVQDVTPGGGILPSGTVVRIDGTGFTQATTLQIDGVSVTSTEFVSAQQLNFTLGAPADLTGKRLLLTNPDGTSLDYFSAFRGTFVTRPTTAPYASLQPIFPLQTYAAADAGNFDSSPSALALENQTSQPVDVTFWSFSSLIPTTPSVTLPPGGIYVQLGDQLGGYLEVIPSAPIRMALVNQFIEAQPASSFPYESVGAIPYPGTQCAASLDGFTPEIYGYLSDTNPLTWNWQVGTNPPAPKKLVVELGSAPTGTVAFTVSATTASGGHWLSVSPTRGTTCNCSLCLNCPAASTFTASVDTSKLSRGTYRGAISVTPTGVFNPQPNVIPVVLSISASPTISVSSTYSGFYPGGPQLYFQTSSFTAAPLSARVSITTNGGSAAFSVAVSTQSGRKWLSAAPIYGEAPATLTVTADPKLFQPLPGVYYDSGTVKITGPRNTQSIAVQFDYAPPIVLTADPASLQFFAQSGQPAPPAQILFVGVTPFSVSLQPKNSGKWLQAAVRDPKLPYVNVSVDATGLTPGTYQDSIEISSPLAAAPVTATVTLTVYASPPALVVVPSSLAFIAHSGSFADAMPLSISSGNIPLSLDISASTTGGNDWLGYTAPFGWTGLTPVTVSISATAQISAPGTYTGAVNLTAPPNTNNSVSIPVTLTVTPALPPVAQPGATLAVSVVNAASQITGAVAPGEIITILGQNIGPAAAAGFTLDVNGKVATNLNGARVLFNGIAAPLLYAQSTQVNAIVPYEVALSSPVTIQVEWNGARGMAVGVPVASTAPAVFTLDSGGAGRAAVLNQDGSVNGPANPAPRGSIIQIFATGEGLTSPPGNTGEVTGRDTKKPVQPVTLTIGGDDAFVTYAGSAPDAVAGLFQVNAEVPQNVTPGPTVPILLSVGTAHSQTGVTVAVK
jgi:uncharacterized protein (TIGR03437 family)